MFLARTELAGQNVSLSRLFGTLNTPSCIVIINSGGNRGPAESWARRLRSGRALQRGDEASGWMASVPGGIYTWSAEQLCALASPGKRPRAISTRSIVSFDPQSPAIVACVLGDTAGASLRHLLTSKMTDKTTSFIGKRRLGSWKFHRQNDRSSSLEKC